MDIEVPTFCRDFYNLIRNTLCRKQFPPIGAKHALTYIVCVIFTVILVDLLAGSDIFIVYAFFTRRSDSIAILLPLSIIAFWVVNGKYRSLVRNPRVSLYRMGSKLLMVSLASAKSV